MNLSVLARAPRGLAGAIAALAFALIAGCGGGSAGVDSGTTTAAAFTAGPISGFGSIIVNGVRFDDSSAEIEDEDGARHGRDDLKLGAMVEVESEAIDDNTSRAHALRIRFGSEIVGPVESVDTAANSFVVLGQTVEVRPATVFDDSLSGGVAGLAGQTVEVHALFDAANGHYIATRIEDKANPAFYKLRGVISAHDATAKTFRIGDALISYAGVAADALPPAFGDGLRVRVRLQTTPVAGAWVAVTIRSGVRRVEDIDRARLRGSVTALTSPTAFEVNGIPVDASNAEIEHGPVVLGARVEVRGRASEGTIVATRVKVLREDDDEVCGIELHGTISNLDTTAETFTLRGTTVSYAAPVLFKDGSAAQLVDGVQLEVKGVLSADGNTLKALVIEFEN